MHLLGKKKTLKKRCVNLFNPAPEIFQATFTENIVTEIKELVDYWRPEGELDRLIQNDYFFRELLRDAEILITGWGTPRLPFDLLHNGSLAYICHVTGTIRQCISKDFLEKGFLVTNWGNAISHSIAEAALMLILACNRRLGFVRKSIEAGNWNQFSHPPQSLCHQRVGLLGLGAVAQDLAALLRFFKVRLQAYDPYATDEVFQKFEIQRVKNLKSLFSENDIISLHAALTPELEGVVNRELLALMPDNGILINTANGKLINENDLLDELKQGRLWCGLDVFAVEPLPADALFRFLPRCIITPHIAGPTSNCYWEMGDLALNNIKRFLKGEPLVGKINPEQYDRIS